jgi:hypothetical protein
MVSRGEVRVGVCSGGRSQCDFLFEQRLLKQ